MVTVATTAGGDGGGGEFHWLTGYLSRSTARRMPSRQSISPKMKITCRSFVRPPEEADVGQGQAVKQCLNSKRPRNVRAPPRPSAGSRRRARSSPWGKTSRSPACASTCSRSPPAAPSAAHARARPPVSSNPAPAHAETSKIAHQSSLFTDAAQLYLHELISCAVFQWGAR